MIHSCLSVFDNLVGVDKASAHCDIPCKIYDPISAQLATLSVIRFLDLISELESQGQLTLSQQASFVRLVAEKEEHVAKVKQEVLVIWGDYFKQPQFEQVPNIHSLVHNIMLAASACKQNIGRDKGVHLLELVNQFAEAFWKTKGIKTYAATCPYPPLETLIYPTLG